MIQIWKKVQGGYWFIFLKVPGGWRGAGEVPGEEDLGTRNEKEQASGTQET